jgi:hypothetical protein
MFANLFDQHADRDSGSRLRTKCGVETLLPRMKKEERIMARGLLLWLLGVPLSVIILLALFTNIV